MIFMIARIVDNKDKLIGFRMIDTKTKKIMDTTCESIMQAMKNKKVKIENLKLVNNELKGINGSIDRYTRIRFLKDTYNSVAADHVSIVILAKTSDNKYMCCDYKGKVVCTEEKNVSSHMFGIANGKWVNNHLSAIEGEYSRLDNSNILEKIAKYNAKCAMLGVIPVNFIVEGKEVIVSRVNKNANRVIIPDFVTTIDRMAFYGMQQLKEVVIPEGVREIQSEAFRNCRNIERISLPSSLTKICENVFNNCESLKVINIPRKVTEIQERAFEHCRELSELEFPKGLKSIGESAFADCIKLETIKFPSRLEKIDEYAFYKCTSLKNIKWPMSIEIIEKGAFGNCRSLNNIRIPKTSIIKEYTFANCDSLSQVAIANGVSKIENYAFKNCGLLYYVSIPRTITSIDDGAFMGTSRDFTLGVPKGMKQAADYFSRATGCKIHMF